MEMKNRIREAEIAALKKELTKIEGMLDEVSEIDKKVASQKRKLAIIKDLEKGSGNPNC